MVTALDLHYLVREFKELENSKVDKIYAPDKKELLIQFFISGKGKKILRIIVPEAILLTGKKENAERPSGFCMFLRKALEGSRLREIRQINSERIVELQFEAKEKGYYLIIELFSKGNIVLCDSGHKIIGLVEKQKWKDRIIEVSEKYIFPKREYNFLEMGEKEFNDFIKNSKRESIVKALAAELGLGGEYAEEICSDINKNKKLKDLENDEIKSLFLKLRELIDREIENISEKIESKLENSIKLPSKSKERTKIENIIKSQEEHIEEVKHEIEENNIKAEIIYEKYQLVESILNQIKKAREKYSWKEIEDKLKNHKLIKKIISKEQKVIIEI